jgi:hypothetical protein
MADASRFRSKFNGPMASAMYNERHTIGCLGCQENKTMKNMPSVHFCVKAQSDFPHTGKGDCEFWKKKERK